MTFYERRREWERREIEKALKESRTRADAAKVLGMNRGHLYRRMNQFGIPVRPYCRD